MKFDHEQLVYIIGSRVRRYQRYHLDVDLWLAQLAFERLQIAEQVGYLLEACDAFGIEAGNIPEIKALLCIGEPKPAPTSSHQVLARLMHGASR